MEERIGGGSDEQRLDDLGAARLTGERDASRIAAEKCDLLLYHLCRVLNQRAF